MNLLAAAATQPMPTQQMPAHQNMTTQPDRPAPKPSLKAQVFSYGFLIGYLAIVIFVVMMVYRFVRAFEKIADSVNKGIVIKKD